jgi:hypothetical protein
MGHAYNFRDSEGPKGTKMPSAGPKTLRRLEVTPGKNGGHSVNHVFNYNPGPGPSHPDEEHIFGASEGPKLMAHLQKHLGIKAPAPPPVPAAGPSANALEQ